MHFAVYVLLSMVLLLGACSAGPNSGAPPQAAMNSESGGAGADIAGVIFVVPLEGAPSRTGLVLADAIAAEIRDKNHPAILSYEPNQAGASVVGKVATADVRGDVVWLAVDWAIRAPYGTHVATYRQHVVIDDQMWRTAAPEAINLVIADAAPKLASMVSDEVGPPMLAAMRRPEDNKPQPDPKIASDGPATTLEMRKNEMATAQDPAPAPGAGPVQPLAHIAETTNGQVVHAAGMTTQTEAESQAPITVAPPVPAGETPPPTGLPSLLMPIPGDAQVADSAVASSGPPQPLMPGTQIIQPPPGGVAQANAEETGSFLDALSPNLDSAARLPDDARPAGAGGAAFAKVRWGQPSFLIRPVRGAPGNGNEALTAALKTALRDRDLTISEDPRQAGFIIDGLVNTGDPVNGRQYIRIIWQVNTVTGEEVGKAVQENTVVAGSLDGEWGNVAEAVSHAAVRGIKDLFSDADERLTSREPLPNFPDVRLAPMPGRAPPPPASY